MENLYNKASLVLTPQMVETGKVYSMKPEDRKGDFTFSRSTAATRVNASGNIEKETGNLLLQSNQFDTTWANVNSTETGGQSGYDGSNNAWLLNTTNVFSSVRQSISQSGVQTLSVYAKAGSYNFVRLGCYDGSNIYDSYFDLQNGTLGTGLNEIDANIESIGSGWYRCSVSVNTNTTEVRIYSAVADNDGTGTSGNIYIQDAQLEQGLVARDYIETTTTAIYGGITDNVPRLDYTDSSCPALLLEPLRTNLITQSEYTGGYGNFGSTDTANQASSPEGVNNAVLLEGDGTQPQVFFNAPNMTLSSAGSYALSIFAKKGTNNYMQLSLDGFTGAGNGSAYFDLENGTTPSSGASIEDYGNGWYRCILISTIDAGDLFGRVVIRVAPSTSTFLFASPSAANGQNIYIYGFQFEAGSYATSYIPTYGSAVTRNNDNVSYTQQVTDSSSFAVFIEFEPTNQSPEGDGSSIQYPSVTDSYWARLYPYYTNEKTRLLLRGTGFSDNIYSPSSHDTSTNNKWLISFDGTRLKAFANGEKLYDEVKTPYEFQSAGTGIQGMIVKSILNFNAPLTDQEAIDLTTI